ncbi:ATP-binding cassette domain-containing protein [Cohnella luojiensis]|uniref:ABC transporter ATP-binding protein n=1 Tax=Cohnella luojiensis TaxID=652876 RepID=A0A4Y8LPS6_9BACL|nr:ABC transporter ATP-binding protein [Cohnella luojiensis]TFE19838.1 ABC transporter ATP-binding protein [Cohnella luojiensis]
MLTVSNLSKTIDGQAVLRGVDFKLEQGRVVGVVGRNGAGKTTLFKTMAGILIPDAGTVEYEGQSIHATPSKKLNIVFIPDSPEALFSYTAMESALFFSHIYPTFDKGFFSNTLHKLELPLDRKIRQFSKGMRMLFSTVLGLATKAPFVLLDEPTNGIDAIAKKQVMTLLMEAAEEGTTLVISSHLLNELERVADTILVMKAGGIETHDMDETANGAVRKFQVVFRDEAPASWLNSPSVRVLDKIGRVYTVLVDTKAPIGALEEMGKFDPLLMEHLPMKLEDLFVWKLGGSNYVG